MVSIPAGESVLDWRFASTWGADPSDACWLDQVSFVPTTPDFWVVLWTGSGSTPAELTIHGEPGGLYELQVSTNLLDWTPSAGLSWTWRTAASPPWSTIPPLKAALASTARASCRRV
jgi:hypothetical protein